MAAPGQEFARGDETTHAAHRLPRVGRTLTCRRARCKDRAAHRNTAIAAQVARLRAGTGEANEHRSPPGTS